MIAFKSRATLSSLLINMGMGTSLTFAEMHNTLQDALDDLLSSRSSMDSKNEALDTLCRLMAFSCLFSESMDSFSTFLALQDTFECNVPSRILMWIASSIPKLELLTTKGSMDHEKASTLSAQLSLSLFLIQGVVLHHEASKRYTGRKHTLQILLDLLLASRHLSSIPLNTASNTLSSTPPDPALFLSSVILDTLLCVLVDSPVALRTFEESNGLQAVVKILKRAGTPREVRMKCLEFLYFYLLDETTPSTPTPTHSSTAPATPQPTSEMDYSSRSSFSTQSSSSTSRTSSWGSMSSLSSTSAYSIDTATTCNTTPPVSPPPSPSPCSRPCTHDLRPPTTQVSSRTLHMLRKEVDYVPLSPKKAHALLGVGRGTRPTLIKTGAVKPHSRMPSDASESSGTGFEDEMPRVYGQRMEREPWVGPEEKGNARGRLTTTKGSFTRTTDEKKEILGGMLGNVDALVDGVSKAGIWGLG